MEQNGKLFGYGYRVHALVNADAEALVAVHIMPANENDASQWNALWKISQKNVNWDHVGWFTADKAYDTETVRNTFNNRSVQLAVPAANTPKRLPHGGLRGTKARVYKKRTSVERFFRMPQRFFSLHRWESRDSLERASGFSSRASPPSLLRGPIARPVGSRAA